MCSLGQRTPQLRRPPLPRAAHVAHRARSRVVVPRAQTAGVATRPSHQSDQAPAVGSAVEPHEQSARDHISEMMREDESARRIWDLQVIAHHLYSRRQMFAQPASVLQARRCACGWSDNQLWNACIRFGTVGDPAAAVLRLCICHQCCARTSAGRDQGCHHTQWRRLLLASCEYRADERQRQGVLPRQRWPELLRYRGTAYGNTRLAHLRPYIDLAAVGLQPAAQTWLGSQLLPSQVHEGNGSKLAWLSAPRSVVVSECQAFCVQL